MIRFIHTTLNMGAEEFRALTSMRGIAALCVAIYHIVVALGGHPPAFYLWVDFFFVLSGFVLMHVYGAPNQGRQDYATITKFFCDRLSRIYPLHVFMLLLVVVATLTSFALGFSGSGPSLDAGIDKLAAESIYLPGNLLLVHAWNIYGQLSWNQPSWSISAEFFCYLTFPFIVACRLITFPVRAAVTGLACLLVILLLVGYKGNLDVTYDFAVIRAQAGFLVGAITYQCRRQAVVVLQRILPISAWQILSLLGLFLTMFASLRWLDFLSPLLSAALVASLSVRREGIVQAVLEREPFHLLGEISYSVYMTHFMVVLIANKVLPGLLQSQLSANLYPAAFAITSILLILCVSYVTYHAIELPAKRAMRGHLYRALFPARR